MRLDRRALLLTAGTLGSRFLADPVAGRGGERPPTERGQRTNRSVGQAGYAPLGSVDVPGAREAVPEGDVVYVAAGDGFAVVDATDPAKPDVLAERREIETDGDASLSGIWDVWPDGDLLAVAGPAHSAPGRPSGVALFDVSDPSAPEQVAFHPTDDPVHNLHLADGTAYLTSRDEGHSLVIVDASDGNPVEVGRWSPLAADERWADVHPSLRTLHDVYVQAGVAYLPYWDAGTWMVDVSDPADPEPLGRVADYAREELAAVPTDRANLVAQTPCGADHYAQVDSTGTVLAVGRETWAVDDAAGRVSDPDQRVGGASGVTLYDVRDPARPEQLATIEPPASFDQRLGGWFTTAHNFDLRDGRLYTSWYFGGVAVFDVTNPANPTELARWRAPREASFWTARAVADGAFVASSADIDDIFEAPDGTREALYVFPDEAGSQADPPSLTERPTDLVGTGPEEQPPVDRKAASASRVTDVEVDGTGNASTERDSVSDDDGDAAGPGLGVTAALAGLGGYLLARRTGRLSDSHGE